MYLKIFLTIFLMSGICYGQYDTVITVHRDTTGTDTNKYDTLIYPQMKPLSAPYYQFLYNRKDTATAYNQTMWYNNGSLWFKRDRTHKYDLLLDSTFYITKWDTLGFKNIPLDTTFLITRWDTAGFGGGSGSSIDTSLFKRKADSVNINGYATNIKLMDSINRHVQMVTKGGTGLTSLTQGDILYASGTNLLTTLSKNTTASRYLSNAGGSNNPSWVQIDLSNGITGTIPKSNVDTTLFITRYDTTGFYNLPSGTVTSIVAGAGMDFTTITGTGTIAMGTPTTLTISTSNSTSGITHAHEISQWDHTYAYGSTGSMSNNSLNVDNIKIGGYAGKKGQENIAIGNFALTNVSSGTQFNIAIGTSALSSIIPVSGFIYGNIGIGINSGYDITGNYNTCIGSYTNISSTKTYSTVIGFQAATSKSSVMKLGRDGTVSTGEGQVQVLIGTDDNTLGIGGDSSRFIVAGGGYFTGNLRANAFIATSDIKQKKNITLLQSDTALTKIKKLNSVSFKWKKDSINNKKTFGLIAQDVEAIIPEAVHNGRSLISQDSVGIRIIDTLEYKKSKGERGYSVILNEISEDTKGIDYSVITVHLLEAIKELSIKVEALENRVKILESNLK